MSVLLKIAKKRVKELNLALYDKLPSVIISVLNLFTPFTVPC